MTEVNDAINQRQYPQAYHYDRSTQKSVYLGDGMMIVLLVILSQKYQALVVSHRQYFIGLIHN